MPTIEQIRAARALLGWSQHDLADKAGLSQTGIARIENGTNQPNSKTIQKIETAFDKADVEFLGNNGVRKRTGEVRILEGREGMRQFFDELYEAAAAGEQLCLFNGVPSKLEEWLGEDWYSMHKERMQKVKDRFTYNIIVKRGEKALQAINYANYRYFPEHLFHDKTIYILGNKVFFRDLDNENHLRLIRLEQPELAKSMKVLFDIAWEKVAEAE